MQPISSLTVTSQFAECVLAASASLCARFVFGLDWVNSVLLFLPTKLLIGQIFENNGVAILKHVLVLALFPLVMQISSIIAAKILAFAAAGAADTATIVSQTAHVASGILVLLGFYSLAHVVSGLFGNFMLPDVLHKVLCYALEIFARLMLLVFGIVLVKLCEERFVAISTPLKIILSIVICAGVVVSIMRVFKKDVRCKSRASFGSAGANHLRVDCNQNAKLADVIGMDDAKEQIRLRLIEPVRNPSKAKMYGLSVGGGVLLYGPPGTGKTMLARAVAGELGVPFFMITAADVFGKYVGESERNMRAIFAEIRKCPLSVLFVDEMETLFPSRADDVHETTRKVISVILQELDGLDKKKNPILLLGATNVPWMVDEAFLRPGRFDIKIFVGLPDEHARRRMLETLFAKGRIPLEHDLLAFMAAHTVNYSGADINGVMDRLRQLAYASGASVYTRELAMRAIESVSPTANGDIMDRIQDWEARAMPSNSRNSGSNGILIASRPEVKLSDVAGLDSVKEQIRLRVVEPLRNSSLAKHYGIRSGGGMLLYGPPGTGKTFIARAVAGELDLPFYTISSADVFSKYIGESERNIAKIFREIRKNDLAVVFIDELETLFPKRSADVHETTRKVIALLLQELDGLDKKKNPILLMGATNVPWMVDEAFLRPGRFDVCLYVGLPDVAARRKMVHLTLESGEVPYEVGIDEYIANRTEGFSGADIKGFLDMLRQFAFKNRLRFYKCETVDRLLGEFRPTNSEEMIAKIRNWEANRQVD